MAAAIVKTALSVQEPTIGKENANAEYLQPLALQESDIDDLVAFLASLTSNDYNKQAVRELARQRALSQTNRPQRDTARAFGPKPVKPRPPEP